MSTRHYIKRFNGKDESKTFYELHKNQFWFIFVLVIIVIALQLLSGGLI